MLSTFQLNNLIQKNVVLCCVIVHVVIYPNKLFYHIHMVNNHVVSVTIMCTTNCFHSEVFLCNNIIIKYDTICVIRSEIPFLLIRSLINAKILHKF